MADVVLQIERSEFVFVGLNAVNVDHLVVEFYLFLIGQFE